jgi:microcystin-dependent protein
MQTPFLGQITFYPYNFAPSRWAMCFGQLIPISQNAALFSLLGTAFGGNGTSNFGLPDLRGRVSIGQGQLPGGDTYVMGEIAGLENVTITTQTMPGHNHTLNATTNAGTTNNPAGAFLANPLTGRGQGGSTGNIYNPGTVNTILVPASLPSSGNNIPHNNMQPTLFLTPCIALQGAFPARN